MKDFDRWNGLKKKIDQRNRKPYAHSREIWWCSLGINIGVETDGKNDYFERPVLIIKVYNKESLLVLPITSKENNDPFHFEIHFKNITTWIKLTQLRTISTKRLYRKIRTLDQETFTVLISKIKELL
ncbi:MAG TPA: type II toxin-antitoxin system PemK/MazF family toxin [Candidatus Paceibacterota bacterium]|jgi:mRNA-degrading endonuclease toxin of MazEF toxin-antitoxin module|nr:type II toxin-antitoxin system PemK/MazF family toxin [Candidatus Paceibacterota bacterium]